MKVGQVVRQGDVLLMRVVDRRQNGQQIPREGGRLVLAHGEATGHSHAVCTQEAEMFSVEDQRFLRMIESGQLVHEEHDPLELDRGLYRVIIQKEYAPGAVRNVSD